MPSRVDRLEKRKKKFIKKVLPKLSETRGKKADRIAVRGDKKIDRINKKIGKSMARQEKRGIRKADREAVTYGGSVKTSGMRKKAKKNR